MQFKDYYAIMGVARDATATEIKRAYRKLARQYHPDVSKEPDAEARFKELGEANAVLKDPEKRAAYDQLGPDWKAGQDFTAPPGWDAGFEFQGDGGAHFTDSDFFEALFGGHFQQRENAQSFSGVSPGADHHAKIAIDIEDAWRGAKRSFTLQMPEIDSSGRLQSRQRTISVRIPKGVKQGQHIRLTGLGERSSLTGEPGDLYLEVEFKPHPLFRAEGHDLYMDLPVAPWEAALGARVKVPTPAGPIELTIPGGSATGKKLRVKGRGIPGPTAGDFYAVLRITLPPADTKSARELYVNMRKELAFDPRAGLNMQD